MTGFRLDELAAWAGAWAVSRRMPTPELRGGALRADVPGENARRELIGFAAAGPDAVRAWRAAEPHAWITLIGAEAAASAALLREVGLGVAAEHETFMAADLVATPAIPPPFPGDELVVTSSADERGVRLEAVITVAEGEVAAHGQVGIVGELAVPDRIRTAESHRRRGLGRLVMAVLADAAYQAGARRGMLLASAEGRALYTSLGWRPIAAAVIGRPASALPKS